MSKLWPQNALTSAGFFVAQRAMVLQATLQESHLKRTFSGSSKALKQKKSAAATAAAAGPFPEPFLPPSPPFPFREPPPLPSCSCPRYWTNLGAQNQSKKEGGKKNKDSKTGFGLVRISREKSGREGLIIQQHHLASCQVTLLMVLLNDDRHYLEWARQVW